MKIFVFILFIFSIYSFSEAVTAPDFFQLEFLTTVKKGDSKILFNISRAYSPLGVDRLYELLTLSPSYYTENGLFRVIPGFVVQFGICGDPKVSQQWENKYIRDDPVKLSNKRGVVSYAKAGPNTRTTQLYINYVDNVGLDSQGFSGIGMIVQGFDVATAINPQYRESPNQELIYQQGNSYLKSKFPNLDYIISTRIITNP